MSSSRVLVVGALVGLLGAAAVACSGGPAEIPGASDDDGTGQIEAGAGSSNDDGDDQNQDDDAVVAVDAGTDAASAGSEGGAPDAGNDDDDDSPGVNLGPLKTCKASYYASGAKTANGETFKPDGLTAAHKTFPFNTKVRVTNSANGKTVDVRINDRGPFVASRCLDLARGAFAKISPLSAGVITVKYAVINP